MDNSNVSTIVYVNTYERLMKEGQNGPMDIAFTDNPVAIMNVYDLLGLNHLRYDIQAVAYCDGFMILLKPSEEEMEEESKMRYYIDTIEKSIDRFRRSSNVCCNICMDEDEKTLLMCSSNSTCDKLMCSTCLGKLVMHTGMNIQCPFCRMSFGDRYIRKYEDIVLTYGMMLNMVVDLAIAEGGSLLFAVAVEVEFQNEYCDRYTMLRIGSEYNSWIGRFYEVCVRMAETRARVFVCGTRTTEYLF